MKDPSSKAWDNGAEDDPSTLHTSYTCNTNQEQLRILPKEVDHEKKATLGGTFDCHTNLERKERVGR